MPDRFHHESLQVGDVPRHTDDLPRHASDLPICSDTLPIDADELSICADELAKYARDWPMYEGDQHNAVIEGPKCKQPLVLIGRAMSKQLLRCCKNSWYLRRFTPVQHSAIAYL